jgi:hypothetical protein
MLFTGIQKLTNKEGLHSAMRKTSILYILRSQSILTAAKRSIAPLICNEVFYSTLRSDKISAEEEKVITDAIKLPNTDRRVGRKSTEERVWGG